MTGSRAAAAAFLLALLSAVAAAPASYSAAGGVYIVTVRPPAACVDSGWYQMHILATALGRYLCRTIFHPHRFRSIDFFFCKIYHKRGEGEAGAALQLQDGDERVRGQAHAGAARRVAE
jgi:hypothetical protein